MYCVVQEDGQNRMLRFIGYAKNCGQLKSAEVILIGGMLSSRMVGVVEPERGKLADIGVETPEGSSLNMKRTRCRCSCARAKGQYEVGNRVTKHNAWR